MTAALHLAERGLSPLVLEADPNFPGGRMAGGKVIEVDGWEFRQEHGVHGVWSPYRNLQAMLGRHGIRPAFVPAQEETWIYKKNGRVKRADVGSALRRGAAVEELRATAVSQGMTTMAADGIRRAARGEVVLAEVLQVLGLR